MALISPDEWLHEVSTARRAAAGPWRGVTQPGVVLGWGSAAFVGWLAVACVVGLLIVEGLDWVTAALSVAAGVFAWLSGWPFAVVVTSRGVLSRRGFVRFDRIVAAGWASSGERMIPLAEGYVPVLVVEGDSGALEWWPLAEVRKGAVSSTEKSRMRLLKRLVGARDVDHVPIPSEVAPSLNWPWGA